MDRLDNHQFASDRQDLAPLHQQELENPDLADSNLADIEHPDRLSSISNGDRQNLDFAHAKLADPDSLALQNDQAQDALAVDLAQPKPETSQSVPKIEKQVYVCQYRTCKKDGSEQVLEALQAEDLPNVSVSECGCLGLCGSGPMVMVTPDEVYYWRVKINEVAAIAEQHLRGGEPIPYMLHPRVHPDPQQFMPGN